MSPGLILATIGLFVPAPAGRPAQMVMDGMTARTCAVLVVDDDPIVRATAVHLFQDLGFEVFDTYNGRDALRLVTLHPRIGLLFADVRMPRMNGLELAREAQAIRPDLKVVFTSGYVDSASLPSQASFVAKPWSVADIVSAVQAAKQPPTSV